MLQLTVTRLVPSSVLLFGVVLVSPRCLHPSGRVANTLAPVGSLQPLRFSISLA
jgi:hypothetical protein